MEIEKKVTYLSIGLSFTVFVIKLITSLLVSSLSYFTEFSDSLLDIFSVIITLYALKESKKPPDSDHMYGHHKINSLAGFIQSLLLCGLYGSILFSSIKKMIKPDEIFVENSIFGAISLSIIIVLVYFVSKSMLKLGKETRNLAIIAQAKNFRTDFYRNFVVIIGLILLKFNLLILDPILASIIAVIGIYNGIILLKESTNELVDSNALTDEIINNIKNNILKIAEIAKIDKFALRTVGNEIETIISLSLKGDIIRGEIDFLNLQIKNLISRQFPSFKTNTYIEIKEINYENNNSNMQNTFALVRKLGDLDEHLQNIHNIIIEQFKDQILIQYHANIDPKTNIQLTHQYATILEDKISKGVQNYYKKMNIEVISHIEPLPPQEITHSHPRIEDNSKSLKNKINSIISEFKMIEGKIETSLHRISDGYSLIIRLNFPSKMTIFEVHEITEIIENRIISQIRKIKNCLIHAEAN